MPIDKSQGETPLIKVLHKDADILIVEKPAGIPTQPQPAPTHSRSLASDLNRTYSELKTVGGNDLGAVHRLDVDTSGIVVFARNQETYARLREDFSKNRVGKEYMALVEGIVDTPGRIPWPIGPDPKTKKKVRVYRNLKEARRHKAQEALSTYAPLCASGSTTLLQIQIKTGRRHQIRAHLAAIGHPIVGDTLYGRPAASRLCLHASRITLTHPRTGALLEAHSAPSFGEGPASRTSSLPSSLRIPPPHKR